MRLNRFAFAAFTLGLIVAACAGGASPSTATPPTSGPPGLPAPATRIDVKLTDALRIEPAEIRVPSGQPVTFVVTNSGALEHEFFVGDETAQAAHGEEMASAGGMGHDRPNGIGVKPGQTKELTMTFTQAGETIAGCHVLGHYGGGMKATIVIGS